MASEHNGGRTIQKDAKEYLMFCRVRGLFLVEGLEHWRVALQAKGHPEDVVAAKVTAASHFVSRIGTY
jgi:hypothetical protein